MRPPRIPDKAGVQAASESSILVAPSSQTVQRYLHAATSDNTRKAYRSAIRQFEKWGGRLPTTQEVVIQYLLDNAERVNARTLDLHLTAISQWHRYQGMPNPVNSPRVRKVQEGIRRTHGRPKQKAKALRLEHIAQLVLHLQQQPVTLKRARDLAIVLTGFFGAFRRGELVAIQVRDLRWEPEGLIVHLPRSKTDQHAMGTARALPYGHSSTRAATAVRHWLQIAQIQDGPLFRPINRWGQVKARALAPAAINDLLKGLGRECGFDFVEELSSHSFRRGLSTSAAREHIRFELIKKQGGWKNDATVWEYIEEGRQLADNAAIVLMEKLKSLLIKR